jgi:hypothetical protein
MAEANCGELKLDNLKPIYSSCNSSIGITNMNEYMEKYGFYKLKTIYMHQIRI